VLAQNTTINSLVYCHTTCHSQK